MNRIIATLFVSLVLMSAQAMACVTPTNGMKIWNNTVLCPGNYSLPNGISIEANNISLDCDGAILEGNRNLSASNIGINIYNKALVTVKNCNVKSYFEQGISLTLSTNNIISNNNVTHNVCGICLSNSPNNTITGNNASINFWFGPGPIQGYGIVLQFSDGNVIKNNYFNANKVEGILLSNSSFNIISNNDAISNILGIALFSSYNNLIYNNNFDNRAEQARDYGKNSWDNGILAGGNFWSDYHIPSQGCFDNNFDGFCDLPYKIPKGDSKDRYPFVNKSGWRIPLTVNITNPQNSSATNNTAPFWLNVTTNKNAVCEYWYGFCPKTNEPGKPGWSCTQTIVRNMSNTGGTHHSQLIGSSTFFLNSAYTEYEIVVGCSDQYSSGGGKVTFFMDVQPPEIAFNPSTPSTINNITPITLLADFTDWGTGVNIGSCEVCISSDGVCDDEWTSKGVRTYFDYGRFNGTCSYSWDIPREGKYKVSYRIKDAPGNTGMVSKPITVINPNPAVLTVTGTPSIGNTLKFSLSDPANPGKFYYLLASFGTSPGTVLPDNRIIPLNPDPLFFNSLFNYQALGLKNSQFFLGLQGKAIAQWNIPNIPQAVGLTVYIAFITYDPVTQTIPSISKAVNVTILG